jgi:hypothetical protein
VALFFLRNLCSAFRGTNEHWPIGLLLVSHGLIDGLRPLTFSLAHKSKIGPRPCKSQKARVIRHNQAEKLPRVGSRDLVAQGPAGVGRPGDDGRGGEGAAVSVVAEHGGGAGGGGRVPPRRRKELEGRRRTSGGSAASAAGGRRGGRQCRRGGRRAASESKSGKAAEATDDVARGGRRAATLQFTSCSRLVK